MRLELSLLGPLTGRRDGRDLDLGAPQQRALLAVLLVLGGDEPVGTDTIIDVLWRTGSAADPATMVHQYVSRLRRALGPAPGGGRWIERSRGGYVLTGDRVVDLARFRQLRAGGALVEALRLWRGPVAADMPSTVREHPAFVAVGQEYVTAVRAAADSAPPEQVLPLLEQGAAWHPYDEGLQARLLRLLAGNGRRADALTRFQQLRDRLVDELGVEPGADLQRAHRDLLRDPAPATVAPPPAEPARPAQLPAAPAGFTGRTDEMLALDRLAGDSRGVLAVISGLGGVGKTALATHLAHRFAPSFPDGQLFVDLRGFAPVAEPVRPAVALRGFLEALGVPGARQPEDLPGLSALYRSTLAARRMLVVLDNAADEEQVRPLLPGGPGCAVVVTSRRYLGGLVAYEGAEAVVLGPLPAESSRAFLAARLGDARVGAEPEAADRIVGICGGLPLALAVCAAWAGRHPRFPLAAIADELDAAPGLDAFTVAGARHDVRTVFSWSYRHLSDPAARLLRLTALHPGPDVARTTLASTAGQDPAAIRGPLDELVDANLLTERRPGRYVSHDLVRAFAAELVDGDPPAETGEAVRRLLDHYVQTAVAAVHRINANRSHVDCGPVLPGVTPLRFGDQASATSWFALERDNLRAAADLATESGNDSHLWRLSWAVNPYLQHHGGGWQESTALAERALAAARRHGESWWQWYLLNTLGRAAMALWDPVASRGWAGQLVDLGRAEGDDLWTGYGLGALAATYCDLMDPPGPDGAAMAERYADEALRLCDRIDAAGGPADRAASARRLRIAVTPMKAWSLLHGSGGPAAAVRHLHRSLDACRTAGDRIGLQNTWNELGRVHLFTGDHAAAAAAYTEALALLLPHETPRPDMLASLAVCRHELGDREAAARHRDEVLHLIDGVHHSVAQRLREQMRGLDTAGHPDSAVR
ncbi:SARP family transcriptional regulator [Actinoplanes philippinensis]|nr:BTAD domain-containing putative transcriptional regulator [Actinoplanes philippinensis]GIE81754.1 SARP family transcriptional regulator [Actinoplanes philippinensis]